MNEEQVMDEDLIYEEGKPMELPVALSEEERIERGKKLADLEVEREEKLAALKLSTSGAREEIKAMGATIRGLYQSIAKGSEERTVICRDRIDTKRATRERIRLDTNEVVQTEILTATEVYNYRQGKIPGTGESATEEDPFADETEDPAPTPISKGRKRRTTSRV